MTDFGKGLTLKEACGWLRDDRARLDRILEVVERDSVIEGLPPLQESTRQQFRRNLAAISANQSEPA